LRLGRGQQNAGPSSNGPGAEDCGEPITLPIAQRWRVGNELADTPLYRVGIIT
jgi:hypothetical protein